ncbi:MAG TPA: YdeI/OmpD-associated family protein [Anaerolineales bacterium]|nr:YdeI/OmpD-associated family protein [Anaerolineales bacterium]
MTQKQHFCGVIKDAGGGGAYVIIPFDVEQVFGKKRVKIKATIEGEPYRGTLVRMGGPNHMLLILKEIREKIGKTFGDEVFVELEEDHDERKVEIPPDLLQALQVAPQAQSFYERLSYTHQKEYVRWVTEAKRPETRLERIQRTVEGLSQGKREH